jgi:hypothetical protein
MIEPKTPLSQTVVDEVITYKCPWCGGLHSTPMRSDVEEWVVVADCCDVSAEEAAFEETSVSQLTVSLSPSDW